MVVDRRERIVKIGLRYKDWHGIYYIYMSLNLGLRGPFIFRHFYDVFTYMH